MFLTHISFKRHLYIGNSESTIQVFKFIQEKLVELKVDKIVFSDNRIDFQNKLFNRQTTWDLMSIADKGYFSYNKETHTIVYRFSIFRLFVFATIGSCLIGFLSSYISIGLFEFIGLYGMNRLVATIRHKRFFRKLIKEIEKNDIELSLNKKATGKVPVVFGYESK